MNDQDRVEAYTHIYNKPSTLPFVTHFSGQLWSIHLVNFGPIHMYTYLQRKLLRDVGYKVAECISLEAISLHHLSYVGVHQSSLNSFHSLDPGLVLGEFL